MATVTPFVKRMRTQGGTIYTFSSALEDIGLNINERNNVVKMSHYALLNLPSIDAPPSGYETTANRFNVLAIPGAYEEFLYSGAIKDGRVLIAESFQNYALNLEVNLLSQSTYNAALTTTVSERVFWKWLKETGAIRWELYDTSAGRYWKEETDNDASTNLYTSVVKCIGQISAGSVRTDTFGTYNETYVLVPTSFGQTPVWFKQVEDDNYYSGLSITNGNANIYGRENYTYPHPDALSYQAYYDLADSSLSVAGTYDMQYDNSTGSPTTGWWYTYDADTYSTFSLANDNCYFIDSSNYIDEGIYNIDLIYDSANVEFRRSKVDCISIEFDLDNLKTIYNDSTLTFDGLATDSTYVEDDEFDFNAVLIYYSVYNKSLDTVLATNLLGILFLDPPSGNTASWPSEILLPSITKLQSGIDGFGTAYSFRLNVKSDYMLDDTAAAIYDESTSSQTSLSDWSDVLNNLSESLNILNQHSGTINYITNQYLNLTSTQTDLANQITSLQTQVNDVVVDITGTTNSIAMFSDGDDPLVDSSIYMNRGKVGIFASDPTWPVQIDASLKAKDIYIENAIRDTSGNIIIGYGSPIQIGSSTNNRGISFYSGSNTPVFNIATDGSVQIRGYVSEASLGTTFYWSGGSLEASGTGGGGGTQGTQGTTGATGSQGIQGIEGGASAQGTQGTTGDDGAQGTQGIQGIEGGASAQGTQGIQGIIGSQGIQGIEGGASAQGTQGIQGITGAQGIQGITGAQGIQGITGIFDDGSIGFTGSNWVIDVSDSYLRFRYEGIDRMLFTSDGSILASGDMVGFASI